MLEDCNFNTLLTQILGQHFGINLLQVREAFKKNIESLSIFIPRGGGEGGVCEPALTPPLVFFACFKPTCLVFGSPITNVVFTCNLIFHIFSDLFDHLN